jgi:hypothetical protein
MPTAEDLPGRLAGEAQGLHLGRRASKTPSWITLPASTTQGRKSPRSFGGVFAISLLFIAAGWLGVDFGVHWDEHWIVKSWGQTLDQERYSAPLAYPGLYYGLSLPALATAAVTLPDGSDLREHVDGLPFRLTVRRHFVVISALAIVFTFLLARSISGDDLDALVAAVTIGISWQYSPFTAGSSRRIPLWRSSLPSQHG